MALKSLVTGGAGFIGSHLCEALVARGDEVVALDNLSTGARANLETIADHPRFQLIEGDILNERTVEGAVAGMDRVYHLAAAVGVKLVMERAISTIVTNTRGTENVLEACAATKARVLIASSSEVYGKMGESQARPLAEDDDWRLGSTSTRRWSYACTKAIDEFLALAYRDERGLEVVIVRLFNTVGSRQSANYGMVLPAFVKAAREGRDLVVHGDGTQTRCFNYVTDTVEAILRLMEAPAAVGQVVNVGGDRELSINDLASRVIARARASVKVRHIPYATAYGRGFEDMERRTPDLSKLRRLIGETRCRTIDEIIGQVW